ncbi:invasion protein B family protein [Pseudomonas baetica]|uniref:Invasion protein B family protein n=1 Tax=Pseudomonas baetica TaxID=674054 RepID=A0ABX4Q2Y6_9PSED|nr:hypothetical protein [Pseudomonas baetica]MDR9865960.1 hypothetical protein [Pseudomonas baetica]PKA71128.1 invasion protein B family protein [Pseudomonas baetica]PTC19639.1 hypothetical protein C0J26_06355 [Pseudomonas baetica]
MDQSRFTKDLPHGLDELVIEMLTKMGLPSETVRNLDAHSTIAIQIHDMPDVMLSLINNRLWLWSLLPGLTESRLLDEAAAVLSFITTPVEGVEGGQLTLGMGEQGYELKAMVDLDQLQKEDWLQIVFVGFANQLAAICHSLRLGE